LGSQKKVPESFDAHREPQVYFFNFNVLILLVKPRDEPIQGKFSFAGTSGAVIDQKGTNTGNIKDQGHK